MNKNILLIIFAIISAVVLQSSILPVYLAGPFKPDLLLIIVVYLALRSSFKFGSPLSWMLGLLKDVFSGLYLGLNAFVFLIIFLAIKNVADRLYAESSFLFVLTVITATLASAIINLLLLVMLTNVPEIAFSITYGLIPNVLTTAFAASLVTLFPRFSRGNAAL
ncbi:MAG: rod shape-determining protein MreD [Deltaproteobacteria bacterium]